ncbi:MAG: hypothetical protein AAF591_20285 [Verrucomicrobiota bacterium]
MKKSLVLVPLLALTAFAFGVVNVNAQTQAFSDKVGYYTFDVEPSSNLIVSGLVTKKEFQGTIEAPTAGGSVTTITLSSGSLTAGALDENGDVPCAYVELTEAGASQGLVVDIKSNTATTVTLHMTDAQASAAGLSVDDSICIRKHVTLGSLFESAQTGTPPNVLAPGQDFIAMFDESGNQILFKLVSIGGTDVQWQTFAGSVDADDTVVYPGQGFVFVASVAKSLRIGGESVSHVKDTATRVPVFGAGINLTGQINPLNGSSSTVDATNLAAGGGLNNGDIIVTYDNDGSSFSQTGAYQVSGGNFNAIFGPGTIDFTESFVVVPSGGTDVSILLPPGF